MFQFIAANNIEENSGGPNAKLFIRKKMCLTPSKVMYTRTIIRHTHLYVFLYFYLCYLYYMYYMYAYLYYLYAYMCNFDKVQCEAIRFCVKFSAKQLMANLEQNNCSTRVWSVADVLKAMRSDLEWFCGVMLVHLDWGEWSNRCWSWSKCTLRPSRYWPPCRRKWWVLLWRW